MKKVLVAMSGGVDSSVAALLLKQSGYEVAGITMFLGYENGKKITFEEYKKKHEPILKKICELIGIKHYFIDLSEEFDREIVAYFISTYLNGRTPNPCVFCNRKIKFGKLIEFAHKNGYEYLATGHYAKIIEKKGKLFIKRNPYQKDQTYFLYNIKPEYLQYIKFPLSDLKKEEVRKIARENNLPVASKKDSQDICFLGKKKYSDFIKEMADVKFEKGKIISIDGKVLGEHKGIINYTIGQRKGLGISASHPLYVVSIDAKNNKIIVGKKKELFHFKFEVEKLNLFTDKFCKEVQIKIRANFTPKAGKVFVQNKDKLLIIFNEKQPAITPGQAAVIYDNDIVLGGGIITRIVE